MEQINLKTDLSCKHCAAKVEPILKSTKGIVDYTIDLEHSDKIIRISAENVDVNLLIANIKKAGYFAEKL